MIPEKLLICLFGILTFVVTGTIGIEELHHYVKLAKAGQFSYHVSVFFNTTAIKRHCSGAIIGKSSILSAARCILQRNGQIPYAPLIVHTGINDYFFKSYDHQVERVFVPTKYNASDYRSDGNIAVLKLKESLEHSSSTPWSEIPLNTNNVHFSEWVKVRITGYYSRLVNPATGGTLNNDVRLRYIEREIIPDKRCEQRLAEDYAIDETHAKERICTDHYNRISLYVGDLGSPLIHNGALIGVLSIVPPDVEPNKREKLEVFTRISDYAEFIQLAKKKLSSKDATTYKDATLVEENHAIHII